MGCDIHAFIEYKPSGSTVWHSISPSMDRSYIVFGALAGVRSDEVKPLIAPRGIPDGIADRTAERWMIWEDSCHNASWLRKDELIEINKRIEAKKQWTSHDIHSITDIMEALEICGAVETRFVFWFDN